MKLGYRLIIAGTRAPHDPIEVSKIITEVIITWGRPGAILSGAATGVDAIGEDWARANGIPIERYPADWQAHDRAAGPIRNTKMAENADALLAMPGPNSKGTLDMIRKAKDRGLKVWVVPVKGRMAS